MMRTLAIGMLIAWYPILSYAQGIPPRTGAWGYTWGLYPEEQGGSAGRFRWTSGRAVLDLDTPGNATAVELSLAAPSPVRHGRPVEVRLMLGDSVRALTFSDSARQRLQVTPARVGRLKIQIEVSPTLVPARDDPASSDDRVLGVQLFEPRVIVPTAAESGR